MKKSILLILIFFAFSKIYSQPPGFRFIDSLRLEIDSKACFLFEKEKHTGKGDFIITYFVDSTRKNINFIRTALLSKKFSTEVSCYFFNRELIFVQTDYRNEFNQASKDTELLYYHHRKPILSKYEFYKKSYYKKYLKNSDRLLLKSKAYQSTNR